MALQTGALAKQWGTQDKGVGGHIGRLRHFKSPDVIGGREIEHGEGGEGDYI